MASLVRVICLLAVLFAATCSANVLQLNEGNVQQVLSKAEFGFVNFYADWCHFSQALSPIIEEVGKKIKAEITDDTKLVIGKVDCDREVNLAQSYKVNKYPTMKMFRFGRMQKREYRGQRSADAITEFLKSQMKDSVIYVNKPDNSSEASDAIPLPVEADAGAVVGFFKSADSDNYKFFHKVSSIMRDECKFIIVLGVTDQPEKIFFQKGSDANLRSNLPKSDEDTLRDFVTEHCIPLVREITFQNAEELTEEGLPFLILFYHPDDTATVEAFKKAVEKHLVHQRKSVNFLIGKGTLFSHPLHHLGKTVQDLPIIAIDSFKHMYVFPHDVRDSINNAPDKLSNFIADLHSGKLHREFHHGPDPVSQLPPKVEIAPESPNAKDHAPRTDINSDPIKADKIDSAGAGGSDRTPTSPPLSVFKSLSPSRNRYTILRDEL